MEKKSNSLTYPGLLKANKKDGWMKDEEKAKEAMDNVRHGVSAMKFEMSKPNI